MRGIRVGSKVKMNTTGFYDGLEGVVKAFVPSGTDCKEIMDRCGVPKSQLYSSTRSATQDRWLIEIRAKSESQDYVIYVCKTSCNFVLVD